MTRVLPTEVRRVACVGAGVIGGGWAVHFLGQGYDVTTWDPDPEAEGRLRRLVELAWPTVEALGLADGASPDRLTVAPTMAAAVEGAEFIQENAPERIDVKVALLAEIDAAAPPEVVIGSSTSGYLMTDMAAKASHPERMVVAHPFNPPYLLPLVEVVAGAETDPETLDWAAAFFEATGKFVIKMAREVDGFVADRLQEAMWREALHMLDRGEATVEQLDAAIREGPGLRWALMGPFMTNHLAGGEGGMAHAIDQFGPALEGPWSRLKAPKLTPELKEKIVAGCERVAGGWSIPELAKERDGCLIEMLRMIRQRPVPRP
jgi:carnitine 3-dehydrogenase